MTLPKWFIDAALEDASTPKSPCAIRYYTSGLSLPIEPGEISIKLPSGEVHSVPATEASEIHQTRPYWRVWRGYDDSHQAMTAALDWLLTELHNTNAGHPWNPIQVVCQGKTIKEWLTPEDAEAELRITRKQASEQVYRFRGEEEGLSYLKEGQTYGEIIREIIVKYSTLPQSYIDEMYFGNDLHRRMNRLRYALMIARKMKLPQLVALENFAKKHYPLMVQQMEFERKEWEERGKEEEEHGSEENED